MANGTPIANPVWADIQGIFAPFTSQMMWRLDLGSYEDVSANAQIILFRLQVTRDMPPPPFPPLSPAQVQTFANWVAHECPQTASSAPAAGATLGAAPAPAAAASAPPSDRFRYE